MANEELEASKQTLDYGRVDEWCRRIRDTLNEVFEASTADAILLSGGLDTSILAALASQHTKLSAFTIAFKGVNAPDIPYAELMAKRLGLEHTIHRFSEDELYEAIDTVVQVMKCFDPMEIRNSVTIQVGLRIAKEHGAKKVITGDGCDELFAGYSFFFPMSLELLERELTKMWSIMRFSSQPLAENLGIEVELSYLQEKFKTLSMEIPAELKVRKEKGRTHGKWIMRKAFEETLPQEITWRSKAPIEQGSGTTELPSFFEKLISNEQFSEKRERYLTEDNVTLRDKEHLFYYERYRTLLGVPRSGNPNERVCPQCHSNVYEGGNFCRTCGAYPV